MSSLFSMIIMGVVILGIVTIGIKILPKRNNKVGTIFPSLLAVCPDVRIRTIIWHNLLNVKQMEHIIKCLSDFKTAKFFRHEEDIPVDRVLAEPLNPDSLAGAIGGLVKGDTAPRIKVVRYWLHGEPWYVVDDGNHRATAARLMGREKIQAIVIGELECFPKAYFLDVDNSNLWKVTPVDAGTEEIGFKPEILEAELDYNMQNAFIDMGVKIVSDDTPMWVRLWESQKHIW